MSPYRLALLLAAVTLAGLILMLVGDGWTDIVGLALAALPLLIGVRGWQRARHDGS